jgi:hypothetical protein
MLGPFRLYSTKLFLQCVYDCNVGFEARQQPTALKDGSEGSNPKAAGPNSAMGMAMATTGR